MSIDKQLNLITSQHHDQPNFIAWLSALLFKIDDAQQAELELQQAYDIDNAIGAQLDSLGVYIGRSRLLTFQPTGGYSAYLDDDTYRLVLYAKIAQNHWDGKMESMLNIFSVFFPQVYLAIQDNQNMSISCAIIGNLSSLMVQLIQNNYIIPKPQGVGITYSFSSTIAFGFGLNNPAFSGFDIGHWA